MPPNLYETDPQAYRVALDRVLGPIGVRRVAATVTAIDTAIDTDAAQVTAVGRDGGTLALGYDRLVLAAGSRVVAPTLPGAEHLFDVDQMSGAARLHSHLHRLPGIRRRRPRRDDHRVVTAGSGPVPRRPGSARAGRSRGWKRTSPRDVPPG